MNNIQNLFEKVLNSSDLSAKKSMLRNFKVMLKDLSNNIQTEERALRNRTADVNNYVDYHADYLSDNQDLLDGLYEEGESLNFTSTSNKVKTAWFGPAEYSYGNVSHPIRDLDEAGPFATQLINHVNADGRWKKVDELLVACYPSGAAFQRRHSDNEADVIDQDSCILNISIGAERDIEFYCKGKKKSTKTIKMEHGSLLVMKGGCQRLFDHQVPPSPTKGKRYLFSLRVSPLSNNSVSSPITNSISDNAKDDGLDVSGDLFDDHIPNDHVTNVTTAQPKNKPTSLILGTSLQVGLIENKLAKRGKVCLNLSKSGNKISDLDSIVDKFYTDDSMNYNIKNVIIAVGINDIKFCRRGINHLMLPITNLANKIKMYFPDAKVYIESVLPMVVRNNFTVTNVHKFNDMLYNVCIRTKCLYLDTFNLFLIPGTTFRNRDLYKGPMNDHLNRKGLAVIAREYIYLINNSKFNPLGY